VNELVLFQKIILALAIGALVGLEREKRARGEIFAGIRTFPLVCLFGLLTGYSSFLVQSYVPIYWGLLIICVLSSLSYYFRYKKTRQLGLTTEIAFILIFMIGIILFFENFPYLISIALGILLTLLLVSKESLHKFAKHLTKREIRDAVIFAVCAFIILPLLPNKPIDPFGVLNPYKIWYIIVLVLSITFAAWVAMKIFGARRGLIFTGFFGGLISSTSVTLTMAEKARKSSKAINSATFAIILASSTMFLRQLFLASFFNLQLLPVLILPLIVLGIAGFLLSLFLWKEIKTRSIIEIHSPLSFRPAIRFSFFFILVLLLVKVVQDYFGVSGVFAISLLAGILDVDAITISLASLAINGLSLFYASLGILLASLSNTFSKWFLTFWVGNKKLFLSSSKIFVPIILVEFLIIFIFSKIFLFG
jgi:uncharacterized membrane protein (DUF4010 family)